MSRSTPRALSGLGPYSIAELRVITDMVWDRLGLPQADKPRVMRADVYDGDTSKPTILLYRERPDWGHFILLLERHSPSGKRVVELFDPEGVNKDSAISHYLRDDITGLNGGGLGKHLRREYENGALISYNDPKHGPQVGDNSCGLHTILRAANPRVPPAEYTKLVTRDK